MWTRSRSFLFCSDGTAAADPFYNNLLAFTAQKTPFSLSRYFYTPKAIKRPFCVKFALYYVDNNHNIFLGCRRVQGLAKRFRSCRDRARIFPGLFRIFQGLPGASAASSPWFRFRVLIVVNYVHCGKI